MDHAGFGIDGGKVAVSRRREDKVAVTGQKRVDPVDGGERHAGVLHHVRLIGRADAGVAERDDDVGTFLAHLGHVGARRLEDVARGDIAFEVLAVPVHDLGRHKADKADLDRMRLTRAVGQHPVEDDVRLDQRRVGSRDAALFLDHVGRDDREVGPGKGLHQEIKAVVEFVVAEGRGVEAHRVHRGDDRVHVAFFHAALIGDVIAHRVALQKVTVVEKERIRRLSPDIGDMGGGAREADGVDGAVAVVIIGPDMHVEVGRFHDAEMRLSGGGPGGEGVQCDQARASGGGEECSAAHVGGVNSVSCGIP